MPLRICEYIFISRGNKICQDKIRQARPASELAREGAWAPVEEAWLLDAEHRRDLAGVSEGALAGAGGSAGLLTLNRNR